MAGDKSCQEIGNNPVASRLDESSGKALNADHDNQAELNKLEAQAANRV